MEQPSNAEIAEALTGPGHTVTSAEVAKWRKNGWQPTPRAMIEANATGYDIELRDAFDDPAEDSQPSEVWTDDQTAWRWVSGADEVSYRVPAPVARLIASLKEELAEEKRKAAHTLQRHRAELADALGTPDPDLTPVPASARKLPAL